MSGLLYLSFHSKDLVGERGGASSAPAEGHSARSVGTFLDERLVELATRMRVDLAPTRLAVVLQTRDVGTEEGRELATTARSLTLVAQLVIQHIRFHLDLRKRNITVYMYTSSSDHLAKLYKV